MGSRESFSGAHGSITQELTKKESLNCTINIELNLMACKVCLNKAVKKETRESLHTSHHKSVHAFTAGYLDVMRRSYTLLGRGIL